MPEGRESKEIRQESQCSELGSPIQALKSRTIVWELVMVKSDWSSWLDLASHLWVCLKIFPEKYNWSWKEVPWMWAVPSFRLRSQFLKQIEKKKINWTPTFISLCFSTVDATRPVASLRGPLCYDRLYQPNHEPK